MAVSKNNFACAIKDTLNCALSSPSDKAFFIGTGSVEFRMHSGMSAGGWFLCYNDPHDGHFMHFSA